jgi:hypothetical protein
MQMEYRSKEELEALVEQWRRDRPDLWPNALGQCTSYRLDTVDELMLERGPNGELWATLQRLLP